MGVGRFVNRVSEKAKKDLPANEIEKFVNSYKSMFDLVKSGLSRFEEVEGDTIKHWYHMNNYEVVRGQLGNSCMRKSSCQSFFKIYTENPEVCSLLILKSVEDGTKIAGRALIWKLEDGSTYMDRVYTVRDEDYLGLFNKWASDNGYLIKSYHNWCSTLQFNQGGEEDEFQFEVKLKKFNHDRYPYLDTFKWLDMESGTLTNFRPDWFSEENLNCRVLSSADSHFFHGDFLKLDEIERDYCYSVDLVEIDGIFTTTSNCRWSDTLNQWILTNDSVYSEELEDYIYQDINRVPSNSIKKRLQAVRKSRGKSTVKDHIDELVDNFIKSYKQLFFI